MCPSVRRPVTHEERSARVFRALLALYPAVFRDEYRRELTLVFIDRYRDTATPWDRARLFLDALMGILAEAPKEHYRMILQDLRYAFRVLRQHALLTTTIVITLGLGIGANTAMFSLLNAVVLRTLPLPDADHLFVVRGGFPLASGNRFSGPMLERLRQGAPEGLGIAAMSRVARVYARTAEERETEPAALQLVSADYFRVLGVSPVRGRPLPADEDGAAASPVAVVSHGYWRRRFDEAPDIVGRTLLINGTGFTIVGVGPQGFSGVWLESPVDAWVPLTMQGAVKYSQNYSADGADSAAAGCHKSGSGGSRSSRVRGPNRRRRPRLRSTPACRALPTTHASRSSHSRRDSPCFGSGSKHRCMRSLPWRRSCCSSPARTSRICFWRGRQGTSATSRCGWRSGPGADGCSSSCWRRVRCSS